jgi:hypothetical protein
MTVILTTRVSTTATIMMMLVYFADPVSDALVQLD